MIYENDKLNIPEKYRTMTASELKVEREKLYKELKGNTNQRSSKKSSLTKKTVSFKF